MRRLLKKTGVASAMREVEKQGTIYRVNYAEDLQKAQYVGIVPPAESFPFLWGPKGDWTIELFSLDHRARELVYCRPDKEYAVAVRRSGDKVAQGTDIGGVLNGSGGFCTHDIPSQHESLLSSTESKKYLKPCWTC